MESLDRFIAALPAPLEHVTTDSRQVRPNSLFVAVPGVARDGADYVPQALANGAQAVVLERPLPDLAVPSLVVPSARWAVAYLSAYLQDFPARHLTMIGVTGTDGKTTTANLLFQILQAAGIRAGMISTVNAVLGGRVAETGLHVTTPDAPDVQAYLAEMRQAGLTHCILETTSHGLAQHRVSVCDFDVAVMTNLSHEHLDYHGDLASYRAAKAMLFQSLSTAVRKPGQPKVAVLNADDESYDFFREIPADRHLAYSLGRPAELQARSIEFRPDSTRFELLTGTECFPVETHLLGRFNVSNVLAAAGAALGLNIGPPAIQAGVAALAGIPGRMERIEGTHPFLLVVDFAHTPNALRRAIETGREMAAPNGRVVTVFGSAGLRDVDKRRLMAEVSARTADLTILTAEDPRTESLDDILADMAAGCVAEGGVEGESFFRAPDRLCAIYQAMELARPGDVVLVCGKGHEQSMCFGTVEYPWDERTAVRRALHAFLRQQPPPDSGLPTAGSCPG